jgi:hypothetical protein
MQFDAMAVPVQLCKRNSQTLALASIRLRRTTLAYGVKSTTFHGVLPGPASRFFAPNITLQYRRGADMPRCNHRLATQHYRLPRAPQRPRHQYA